MFCRRSRSLAIRGAGVTGELLRRVPVARLIKLAVGEATSVVELKPVETEESIMFSVESGAAAFRGLCRRAELDTVGPE